MQHARHHLFGPVVGDPGPAGEFGGLFGAADIDRLTVGKEKLDDAEITDTRTRLLFALGGKGRCCGAGHCEVRAEPHRSPRPVVSVC
ncbi:hypothetical protein [Rhizobium sp. BR 362]|uniref:hypothetical protein n=1 Tax=Rhizobium sp. BR 362 TaxID=3040670 RepID=UPI003FA7B109